MGMQQGQSTRSSSLVVRRPSSMGMQQGQTTRSSSLVVWRPSSIRMQQRRTIRSLSPVVLRPSSLRMLQGSISPSLSLHIISEVVLFENCRDGQLAFGPCQFGGWPWECCRTGQLILGPYQFECCPLGIVPSRTIDSRSLPIRMLSPGNSSEPDN